MTNMKPIMENWRNYLNENEEKIPRKVKIPSKVMEEIEVYLDSVGKDIYEIGMELDVIPASDKENLEYWLNNKVRREGEPPDEELMDEICQDRKIRTPIIIDTTEEHTVEGRHRLAAALKCGLDVPAVILYAKEIDEEVTTNETK
tara:strand:- start:30391 stop:30825 length:435 start_codon:yes stop_codon:yes gene_type:complete